MYSPYFYTEVVRVFANFAHTTSIKMYSLYKNVVEINMFRSNILI